MFPARGSLRGHLRLGSALVAAVIVALGLLGPASATPRAQSKYGGTLVVGLASPDPGSLDPTLTRSAISPLDILKSFCEQLYDYDAKARIVPQLAAALPVISKDKLTYTIAPFASARHCLQRVLLDPPAKTGSVDHRRRRLAD